jgi:hypothetical protein
MSYTERFSLRTHPNVGFNQDRLEIYGRLEDGKAPVTFADDTLKVEQVADSVARRLLSAVMPLVDSATGTGFQEHSRASAFAFNIFGQAVAYFRSVEALIAAYFPVEALAGQRGTDGGGRPVRADGGARRSWFWDRRALRPRLYRRAGSAGCGSRACGH